VPEDGIPAKPHMAVTAPVVQYMFAMMTLGLNSERLKERLIVLLAAVAIDADLVDLLGEIPAVQISL
jgi:hypothetical protein